MLFFFICVRLGLTERRRGNIVNLDNDRVLKLKEKLLRENKVIPATQDSVFKIVMTSCPNYLSFLISEFTSVSKEEIKRKLVIKNNELNLSNAKEKRKISDFIVGIDKLLVNIEMNGKYYE